MPFGRYLTRPAAGYNRTVLLIWPSEHNPEVTRGKKKTLALAQNIESASPTATEEEVAEYLLRAAVSNRIPQAEVVPILLKVACTWADFKLWKRVIRLTGATQSVHLLGMDSVISALVAFGAHRIHPM